MSDTSSTLTTRKIRQLVSQPGRSYRSDNRRRDSETHSATRSGASSDSTLSSRLSSSCADNSAPDADCSTTLPDGTEPVKYIESPYLLDPVYDHFLKDTLARTFAVLLTTCVRTTSSSRITSLGTGAISMSFRNSISTCGIPKTTTVIHSVIVAHEVTATPFSDADQEMHQG